MKGKKESFWGIRFSKEENELIDSLRKDLRLNKSEMIRYLVQQAMTEKNSQVSRLDEKIQELQQNLQTVIGLNRFIANLLMGLIRKSSKSDPGEGEKIIQNARKEALAYREAKEKQSSDLEKN